MIKRSHAIASLIISLVVLLTSADAGIRKNRRRKHSKQAVEIVKELPEVDHDLEVPSNVCGMNLRFKSPTTELTPTVRVHAPLNDLNQLITLPIHLFTETLTYSTSDEIKNFMQTSQQIYDKTKYNDLKLKFRAEGKPLRTVICKKEYALLNALGYVDVSSINAECSRDYLLTELMEDKTFQSNIKKLRMSLSSSRVPKGALACFELHAKGLEDEFSHFHNCYIRDLENFSNLESLDLHDIELNRLHLKTLLEVLPKLENFHELSFSSNDLSDVIGPLRDFLLSVRKLKKLRLNFTHLGPDDLKIILPIVFFENSIPYIDLSGEYLTDKTLPVLSESLRNPSEVRHLNLTVTAGSYEIIKNFAQAITTVDELESVEINAFWASDQLFFELMKALESNTHLKRVTLKTNCLKPSDLELVKTVLSQNSSLDYLELEWEKSDSSEDISSLLTELGTIKTSIANVKLHIQGKPYKF